MYSSVFGLPNGWSMVLLAFQPVRTSQECDVARLLEDLGLESEDVQPRSAIVSFDAEGLFFMGLVSKECLEAVRRILICSHATFMAANDIYLGLWFLSGHLSNLWRPEVVKLCHHLAFISCDWYER